MANLLVAWCQIYDRNYFILMPAATPRRIERDVLLKFVDSYSVLRFSVFVLKATQKVLFSFVKWLLKSDFT
jgi:hypothetical protein